MIDRDQSAKPQSIKLVCVDQLRSMTINRERALFLSLFVNTLYWLGGTLLPRSLGHRRHLRRRELDPLQQLPPTATQPCQSLHQFFTSSSPQDPPYAHLDNTPAAPSLSLKRPKVSPFSLSPLSECMRLCNVEEILGQDHILDLGSVVNIKNFEAHLKFSSTAQQDDNPR